MKEVLCKTCGENTQNFPYIQCRNEPMGPATNYPDGLTPDALKDLKQMHHTACDTYLHKDTPWAAVRFTFPDGTQKVFNDLVQCPKIHGIQQEGKRPIKAEISTGGVFSIEQKQALQKLIIKQIVRAMNPMYGQKVIFCRHSFELLNI